MRKQREEREDEKGEWNVEETKRESEEGCKRKVINVTKEKEKRR